MKLIKIMCVWFCMMIGVLVLPAVSDAADWTWMNPLPNGNTLNGIWGSSGTDVFAVGDVGTIVHFDGNDWLEMNSGTTSDLYGVWGNSESDVYAVGGDGTILHYDGNVWSEMNSGTNEVLTDIWGSSDHDVFAVGEDRTILNYDGSSWSDMYIPLHVDFNGVWGFSSSDVFAVSDSRVFHYDGSSWSEMFYYQSEFKDIWGSSSSDVFTVGYGGTILHFDGNAWSEMTSGTTQGLESVWGSSGSDVFAVGWGGTILHYDGSAWSVMTTMIYNSINAVWGNNGLQVFTAGHFRQILKYDTIEWAEMTFGSYDYLSDVWGSSGSNVYAVGRFGAILQYNGSLWYKTFSDITINLVDIWGSSATDIFAVSGDIFNNKYKTIHFDGSNWSEMNSDIEFKGGWSNSGSDVFAVGHFYNNLHYDGNEWEQTYYPSHIPPRITEVWGTSNTDVFAVGGGGEILHYNGIRWLQMDSGETGYLTGVWGNSGTDVFVVGSNNIILHYDGNSWSRMNIGFLGMPEVVHLESVWGSSGSDVFAVGDYYDQIEQVYTILHYDGSAWSQMLVGSTNDSRLYDVWGSSASDVFAVGNNGTILHYDGSTWSAMPSGTTQTLHGVWGSSGYDVFAVGDYGTILHYDGNQWLEMDTGDDYTWFEDVWGYSGSDVFAVGEAGQIFHYNGSIWSQMDYGTIRYLEGVWGSTNTDVFAVGWEGTIIHYDGNKWSGMLGTIRALQDVSGNSGSNVFAVGYSGTILHYNGSTWSEKINGLHDIADYWPKEYWLESVWCSEGSDVFAVGSDGTILHYNGSTWSEMNSGTENNLYDVWGSSSSEVFTVGDFGTILHYDGSVWSQMHSGTRNNLKGVWGVSNSDVFAVGDGGTILHYGGAISPEINLKQDATSIPDGESYHFGAKRTDTMTETIFTITNSGNGDLTLTTPLTINGDHADQFSITANPASTVQPAESTTFNVRFNPTSVGHKTATISIANDDEDENPYDLTLFGKAAQNATMLTPTPYTELTSTTQTFTWSDSYADQYWLWVGMSLGGKDLYSVDQGTGLSAVVDTLPFEGETVFVRLWSQIDGAWEHNDYWYMAYDFPSVGSVLTDPTPGTELNSRTVAFTWSDAGADQYWLQVGATLGGDDIYSKDQGTGLSATVDNLPHGSERVYVRLWQKAFGEWFYDDYTYTAFNDGAVVEGPVDGSTLTSSSATFTWNASGTSQYWLQVGTTKGGDDIYSADQGTNLSATIDVQKHNGETLYVRLWSKQDGDWVYRDYVYTACNEAAVITSPVHGSDLNSVTQTFTWNDANATQYWLQIGTSMGAKNIYDQDQGTDLTTEVYGLPFQGETLYARLWSKVNGDWIFSDSICYAYDYNDSRANMLTPAPGSTFDSRTVTFTWTDSGAEKYWLYVGTTAGGDEIYSQDHGITTSAEVSGLPHNGETVHVRLWQKVPDDYWSDSNEDHWSYKDYTYTALNQAAIITDPAPGSTFTDTSPTFTWTDVGAAQYWLQVGNSTGAKDIYDQDQEINTSVTVNNMPFNGQSLYVRLWSKVEGDWIKNDYVYTACNLAARMISPTPDSTFASTTQEFIWEDVGAEQYWLYVGSSQGAKDIYSGDQGTDISVTVTGLPNNGQTVYVRLYSQINTQWIFIDYTYTARNQAAPILTPVNGSTFASTSVEFTWEDAGAQQYWLYVGTSVGEDDLYSGDQGLNTSTSVNNLPHNSETVYVRLYSKIDTKWIFNDYTYTACNDGAMIADPASGVTLDSATVVFTWNDVDATQYWLQVGTTQGGSDLYSADQGRNTSATVTALPHNGETVYVRLYSKMNSAWVHNDHTYTARNDAAVMLTPAPGSTFDSSTVTFIWQDAEAEQYWLYVGTSVGASDLYNADQGVNTSVTAWGLPHNGETIYVRLYSLLGGDWIYNDYTYTARYH